MSKSNAFETDLLGLIFNATAIANLADNAGDTPLTNLYFALHTADPGDAGNQSTNEASYTNYERVPVARNGTGFTVSGNAVALAAKLPFAAGVSGDNETLGFWSVGVAASGATKSLYSGELQDSEGDPATVTVIDGVTPAIKAGQIITED